MIIPIILFSYLIVVFITILLDIQSLVLESKIKNKKYSFNDEFDCGIIIFYMLFAPIILIILIISCVVKLIKLYFIILNDSIKIKNNLNAFNQFCNFFANVQNEQFNIENNETYKMIFLKQTTYSDRFYIKYFFYNKIIEIGFKNYNFKIHNFGKLKPYYKILLEKIDIIYKIDIENNINRLNKMFKE